jgi:hypothetical protein
MNLDDVTPAGGGSLRGPAAPAVSEPVATFTLTRAVHPDEIWSPCSGELSPPQRPLTPAPDYCAGAESERPVPAAHMGETPTVGNLVRDTSRAVRAALRPGSIAG